MEQLMLDQQISDTEAITYIHDTIAGQLSDSMYLKSLKIVQNKNDLSVRAENNVVCNIKLNGKTRYIKFSTQDKSVFPSDTKIEDIAKGFSRILINDIHDISMFSQPLTDLFIIELAKLGVGNFGCCHRYEECSDAKECTHPDRLRAMCCDYKKHLEEGRIFYGQNRNVYH
ncbi:hypothetical protein ACS3UN_06920 [Oscillospiraceae bacterium LTW-04]|nr:hypothetical protein RBH76_03440 [Oscillospiraceae bacterium MB24-C1]